MKDHLQHIRDEEVKADLTYLKNLQKANPSISDRRALELLSDMKLELHAEHFARVKRIRNCEVCDAQFDPGLSAECHTPFNKFCIAHRPKTKKEFIKLRMRLRAKSKKGTLSK